MNSNSYGNVVQAVIENDIDAHVEELRIKGYTVVRDVVSDVDLSRWRDKIDAVYAQQETAFGRGALIEIQELDVCRAPLLYDMDFIGLATKPIIMAIAAQILGDWFILHLQNAIINRPNETHHQSSWHRDLPYQNYTISQPLAVSALFAIDDFLPSTGGTHLVPFTHQTALLPSEVYVDNNKLVPEVSAGSVIMFDSMLLHRSGTNISENTRRGVNHVYTKPLLKQQYDFFTAVSERYDGLDSSIMRLLGQGSQTPHDDIAWRTTRQERMRGGK